MKNTLFIFCMLSFLGVPVTVLAQDNNGYEYYNIDDDTLAGALATMRARPHGEAGHTAVDPKYDPYTTGKISMQARNNLDPDHCAYICTYGLVGGSKFTWHFKYKIQMPLWTPYGDKCLPVQHRWNSFYGALDAHEQGHVQKMIDWLQNAGKDWAERLSNVEGTSGLCSSRPEAFNAAKADFKQKFDQMFHQAVDAYDQVQTDYDNGNGHGTTGNPPTVLDTSMSCQ